MTYAWEFGEILVIDRARQVVCGRLELAVPIVDARRAMKRRPDVDLSNIVSWGTLTPDEAALLIGCEPIEGQDDVSQLFDDLMESVNGLQALWSLTYAEDGRANAGAANV